MNKFRVLLSWFGVLIVLGLIFLLFISIFLSPLPPIRFAHIPQETIDFINRITDQGIVINSNPKPGDWINDKAGEDYLKEYKSLEDSNFIIYFLPGSKIAEKAESTLRNANSAVIPLEQMMGIYFYPRLVNNRKLPIYITNSKEEYDAMVRHFVNRDGGGSLGITCFELSSYGFRTLGIILSKEALGSSSEDFSRMVLWHEMNHYVFLTAIEIQKNPSPLTWVVEGIAEYFADNRPRLNDVDKSKCNSINLSEELKSHIDNYWVGYTALLCAEKSYGVSSTRSFIRQNYVSPIKPTIERIFNTNIDEFAKSWRSFIVELP
jgi:hypothetical protein